MNPTYEQHPPIDDVAVYALGALPPDEAARVRAHIVTCAECATEYRMLKPVTGAVGRSAETTGDAIACPSTLLKPRIMAQVRAGAHRARQAEAPRHAVWPAYLVAAACLAIAIVTSVWNVALSGQVRQAQLEAARSQTQARMLALRLTDERTTVADLMATDAKHYAAGNAEIVARGGRLYVTMHAMAEPPRGHVYQVWTLPKGSKTMMPSSTFVPDAHGVAVVALPADARATSVVAISVEPDGGSRHPTTKPIVVIPLS